MLQSIFGLYTSGENMQYPHIWRNSGLSWSKLLYTNTLGGGLHLPLSRPESPSPPVFVYVHKHLRTLKNMPKDPYIWRKSVGDADRVFANMQSCFKSISQFCATYNLGCIGFLLWSFYRKGSQVQAWASLLMGPKNLF